MNERFSGKVVLVAGGTGGLGRAVSKAFLDEDARVIAVTYRNPDELEALQRTAGQARSLRFQGFQVDVTNRVAVQSCIDTLLQQHGRLDAMVNTVGGYTGGHPLWETEEKSLDLMLSLNVRSGFTLASGAVPAMLKQGFGAIVNVASTAATVHGAGLSAYAASKAAAVAMIDSLAADLKEAPVRANSILPSMIDTEANRRAMPNADFSKWPKPEEIARVILFLCSDDAKLVRGAALAV